MFLETLVYGWLLGTIPLSVLLLKGNGRLVMITFLAAIVVPPAAVPVSIIASVRLAKPNSWWARHRYDSLKIREARKRYPDASPEPEQTLATLGFALLAVFGALSLLIGTGTLTAPA